METAQQEPRENRTKSTPQLMADFAMWYSKIHSTLNDTRVNKMLQDKEYTELNRDLVKMSTAITELFLIVTELNLRHGK